MLKRNDKVTIMHNGAPTEVTVLDVIDNIVHTDYGKFEKPMFEVLMDGVERYYELYGKKDNKKVP